VYPVWEGFLFHSAFLVAIVAVAHVIFSHVTVAATWFNWWVERKALLEDKPYLMDYLKASALRLLMLAYTLGAMFGVGIWFSVTASNPRGISTLIHNFVFYWASEWFWFIIDVFGIAVYYYTFGRVNPRTHARIGLILALAASGTLAIIVGILGFKLTPGAWMQSGLSLDGFYNPTFWPMLFARFGLMFALTALYALLVAGSLPKDHPARKEVVPLAGRVGLVGLLVGVGLVLLWYMPSLPEHAKTLLRVPQAIQPVFFAEMAVGVLATFLLLVLALVRPNLAAHPVLAYGALALAFLGLFGTERTREVLRKPDVIYGYMASNQIRYVDLPARGLKAEEPLLNQEGVLKHLPFAVAPGAKAAASAGGGGVDPVKAGRSLVALECSSCHTVSRQTAFLGGMRPLAVMFARRGMTSKEQIRAYLEAIGGFPFMHPVVGTPEERDFMAAYLEKFVREYYGAKAQGGGQ
jgi:mono/diheme cytochrome c family protein